MKTLYMVRHAKSSWKHDVIDHKRPLKGRGRNDAQLVSNYLVNQIECPTLMVSSDATRALSTANYFKNVFAIDEDHFKTNHALYDFSGHNVMEVIKSLDNKYSSVMIFGHNHAFTSIANMLGNTYIENVPTCGFVHLSFKEDSWDNIVTGKTVQTIFPKHLKD